MPHPDKMASARRNALEALKKLQAGGRRVFRSSNFKPEIRKQLLELGYLQEIMRGWLMASSPKDLPGDTTTWHASFWQFVAAYLDDRFSDDWVLSPEQSLSIHAEATAMPKQLLVHSPRGQNNVTKLPHGTSIFDHKSLAMPAASETVLIDGLRLWTIPAALIRVPEHYYISEPMNATVALRSLRNSGAVLDPLLDPPKPVVAGRLIGAFKAVGRDDIAADIVDAFRASGDRIIESNPFSSHTVFGAAKAGDPPICQRLRGIWATCRGAVIEEFLAAGVPSPARVNDVDAYMGAIEDIYRQDAYHSLSIEGYEVTDKIIERVSSPDWDPEGEDKGRTDHDALAARGYYQAFELVKKAVRQIVEGGDSAGEVAKGYTSWYRQLFEPMVRDGLLKANSLAGHRRHPIFLRGSGHVPPRDAVLDDAMDTLMTLLSEEPEHSVRAVLGHWLFGFIHPFPDGNGRTARFTMNVLLAGAGHPWVVIRVEDRAQYQAALEAASLHYDLHPFAKFVAERICWSYGRRTVTSRRLQDMA
jgi:hypothetical protein